MIITQNLTLKEKVYLVELANKVCELPVELETLNSLKPGVLQFILQNSSINIRKKKIIEKILNKIRYKGEIQDGEFLIPEERRIENKNENTL